MGTATGGQLMTITTIKRCQSNYHWWYTVEDTNVEGDPEPKNGLTIRSFHETNKEGTLELFVGKDDALLIRDAINQIYPQSEFPAT